MEEHRENKTAGDCQLDADIKETLLKHLENVLRRAVAKRQERDLSLEN